MQTKPIYPLKRLGGSHSQAVIFLYIFIKKFNPYRLILFVSMVFKEGHLFICFDFRHPDKVEKALEQEGEEKNTTH